MMEEATEGRWVAGAAAGSQAAGGHPGRGEQTTGLPQPAAQLQGKVTAIPAQLPSGSCRAQGISGYGLALQALEVVTTDLMVRSLGVVHTQRSLGRLPVEHSPFNSLICFFLDLLPSPRHPGLL